MSKKTIENYSPEMVTELTEAYTNQTTDQARKAIVEQFAEKFGKSVASVRMRLVRDKVYIKPEATTKAGKPVVKKDELVNKIADLLDVEHELFDSLSKANGFVLNKIWEKLTYQSEREEQETES
jgi:hypothetical protein